jgi:type IV secretion system protein VirB10
MRSKFTKNQEPEEKPLGEKTVIEQEQDEEEVVEVESTGPGIASAKKSKILIIAASSVLITVVLYFLFFKTEGVKKEKLEEVPAPTAQRVAPSEEGKSPFEMEPVEKPKEDLDLLAKPSTPEVPTLPELPESALPSDQGPQQGGLLPKLLPAQPTPAQQPAQQLPTQAQPVPQPQAPVEAAAPAKEEKPKELDPRYAPIIVFSGGAAEGVPSRGVGYDDNIKQLKKDPIDALKRSTPGVVATYLDDRTHTIAQGKLLTAVLETAINTELPGSVRAVVSRDVYGESGNNVLIPRGSRLFGSYSSKITRGQGRVEIIWKRLIRPDGVDLAITFNASDQFGRSGIEGDVDNKYGPIIANSMLTSILTVSAVAIAQKILGNSNNDTTTTTNPTQGTTTTTGNATNQAVYDVSKTITDTVGKVIGNAIDITPVIRVPQGTRITVIVNSDINVPSLSSR